MKISTIAGVIFLMMTVSPALSNPSKGADKMVLFGGKSGNVSFNHRMHQEKLGDCNACHNMFPKKQGAIESLKEDKTIKSKAVMNQCRGCHKTLKKEGKPFGPVSCKACHVK